MRTIARWLFVLTLLALAQCGGTPTGPSTAVSEAIPPGAPTGPVIPLAPSAPQIFVGAGDIAMCDGRSEATARLLDTIGGTVFTLGDHAYPDGTRQEFRDCYDPSWGRHKARTRPVPGNHDYESPGAQPYYEYFGANAGAPGLGYYSFELGAWHAIALNSNIAVDAGSAQAAWLRNDLAASDSRCTIVYWHHPLFTSGPEGPSPSMREFWRIIYAAGAEIVMNGHEHLFERFALQNPDGVPDPARGIREFIAGTGGAFGYQVVRVVPNSEVRVTDQFGVLKLTLASGTYQWEFIGVSGGMGDSGTGTCH